ncbi:50S ribosomal protein L4 [bacterium]|nr:MAG: 50S ribosomal protein L4 [bacterium]
MKKFLEILDNSDIEYELPTLIVTNNVEYNILNSARNFPTIEVTHTGELNAYQVIKAENVIVEKSALDKIEELCKK